MEPPGNFVDDESVSHGAEVVLTDDFDADSCVFVGEESIELDWEPDGGWEIGPRRTIAIDYLHCPCSPRHHDRFDSRLELAV